MQPPTHPANDSFETSDNAEELDKYISKKFYPVALNEKFKQGQYKAIKKLGYGTFSTVWLTESIKTVPGIPRLTALKILKADPSYYEDAVKERQIFNKMSIIAREGSWIETKAQIQKTAHLPDNFDHGSVELLDSFDHFGSNGKHFCYIFEVLGPSLLDVVEFYRKIDMRLPLDLVKGITRQILAGLVFVHEHCGVIHTDIKLENFAIKISQEQVELLAQAPQKKPISMKYLKLLQSSKKGSGQGAKTKGQVTKNGAPSVPGKETKVTSEITKVDKKELEEEALEGKDPIGKSEPEPKKMTSIPSFKWKNLEFDLTSPCTVSLLDFGNAVEATTNLNISIQTCEYRCPETIIRAKITTKSDMWSVACLVFELITGEYLFKPEVHKKINVNEDEDQLAFFEATLGPFPKQFALSGQKSDKYFTKAGKLIASKAVNLKKHSVSDALISDFKFDTETASQIEDFLLPMLVYEPEKRASARQMLDHPWLKP